MSQPRTKLDEDGEKRLALALELVQNNKWRIGFAVSMVLDGWRDMTRVTNPSLRRYLAHALSRRLRGKLLHERQERCEKRVEETTMPMTPHLPIVLLDD